MSLPREQALLLSCLGVPGPLAHRATLASAAPEEWQAVVQLAQKHGLLPLLYSRLRRDCPELALPEVSAGLLRRVYLSNVAESTRNDQALTEILAALQAVAIPVILLKGAFLAARVYGNTALRSMDDLDLLVPRELLAMAVTALEHLGYRPRWQFDLEAEARVSHHLPPLVLAGKPLVELHWTLVPPGLPFAIPGEAVWAQAHPGNLNGAPVLEMACEDLLLHLCLHAACLEYFSNGLRPLCDITLVLEKYETQIDWTRLARRSQEWRVDRSLYLSLLLAGRLLEAPLPSNLDLLLKPASFQPEMVDWAAEQVLNQTDFLESLGDILVPNPWPSRLKIFLRRVFPPPQVMRAAYPRLAAHRRLPLAYLSRLVMLPSRAWPQVVKLLRRDPQTLAAARQEARRSQLVAWQAGMPARKTRSPVKTPGSTSAPKA